MSKFILEMKDISKEYYGNKVLKNVNLNVEQGEIHALLGENGAGKSTLMNILFGMPAIHETGGFKGEVFLDGKKVNIKSPNEALKLGIGMVHQEFMLIPEFTVTENIKLNREISNPNIISKFLGRSLEFLDMKRMDRDAKKALKVVGVNIDEHAKIAGMPVGYMQFVEIAREIDKENIKLLVFDEPTAVLTENEADILIDAMRNISKKGIGIIFITHRLGEVMQVANNTTILRDGELVASKAVKDTDILELANLMVGRKMDTNEILNKDFDKKFNDVAVKVKNFYVSMPGEEVKGIDLDIYKGEIMGIGGLAGQGKIGIANGIMGLYDSYGEVSINGNPLKLNSPLESLHHKLAFVSEDRRGVGLLLNSSIEENIAITAIETKGDFLSKFGFFTQINSKKVREHALNFIKELDIRCTSSIQNAGSLSGGNQQKVCIARALTLHPDILFISEPTRGIDIGAKKLVLDFLVRLNKEMHMTIVMTSSELMELRSICHRIAIVCEGKISSILKPNAPDSEFGLAMAAYSKKVS